MNLVGSLCPCYVATGSFLKSAVNFNAGANTQLAGIIMSLSILFSLLVLKPLFKHLTQDLEQIGGELGKPIEFINLDFTTVTNIDYSAISTLNGLKWQLTARAIQKLSAAGFFEEFGSNEWLFLSTSDADKVTSALVGMKGAKQFVSAV